LICQTARERSDLRAAHDGDRNTRDACRHGGIGQSLDFCD
jgi:hypothetical protein